jgi:hypothetical protein
MFLMSKAFGLLTVEIAKSESTGLHFTMVQASFKVNFPGHPGFENPSSGILTPVGVLKGKNLGYPAHFMG